MPKHNDFLLKVLREGVSHVAVAIGAWENNNPEFHDKLFWVQRKGITGRLIYLIK